MRTRPLATCIVSAAVSLTSPWHLAPAGSRERRSARGWSADSAPVELSATVLTRTLPDDLDLSAGRAASDPWQQPKGTYRMPGTSEPSCQHKKLKRAKS